MNLLLKRTGLATLVAAALAGATSAQTPVAQPAPAASKAPPAIHAPEEWIIYDDNTYTPVVDIVSRHLAAARKAFDAKDNEAAAVEMRAVADELKRQAARADAENKAAIKTEQALVAADRKFARETLARMNASALKVSSAAAAIESGKIRSTADLDKVINTATRADMDRRWDLNDNVSVSYSASEKPQRYFTDAAADYAGKEYTAAAADIRKATSYLRLEAGRATGDSKRELDACIAQLGTLAATVEKGAVKDEQSMAAAFAKADHALALEHRSKAAASWMRKDYNRVGYELDAAAHGLENAAGWVGGEAKAGASATMKDVRSVGDKLAAGAAWTHDEVAKGFESLGNAINALGEKIGGTKKATSIDIGG